MREAIVARKTSETDIKIKLNLDGMGASSVDTGCGFLDHMLTLFTFHGRFDLTVACKGDTNVDDHHTVEDVGIALGRAFSDALGDRAPVIPGIAALSTDEAVRLAQEAKAIGCGGLMVLPPYVYSTDWREMGAHMRAVLSATGLPVLLYNNPVAYGTDFRPEPIAERGDAGDEVR